MTEAILGQRVQTMPGQRLVNHIMRGLLSAPLLSWLVGRRLVTLDVVGRKSGRHYYIPVAYTRIEGDLLVGSPFAWTRNLRTGEPMQLRLQGRRRTADVRVITDEPGVVEAYAVMARDNRNFAKFNHIGFDSSGSPRPADLHEAWVAGAQAVRLTPR